MAFSVTQLFIYPIKSLGGIEVQQTALCSTGFQNDRRWMLVDEQFRFISQRELPKLCLFSLNISPTGFQVNFHNESLNLPDSIEKGTQMVVTIWGDKVTALKAPDWICDWFSDKLNQKIYLVFMPEESQRLVDTKYTQDKEVVSFADGYPILIIGESSLQLLQSKIDHPISIQRFRPNMVFSGGEAHCEDDWKHFGIQLLSFKGIKTCARCSVTTINPLTGTLEKEPLKTLSKYRRVDQKIMFGQNVIGPTTGIVAVGMKIEVRSTSVDSELLRSEKTFFRQGDSP
jgi:uncharacterized protein YcbX